MKPVKEMHVGERLPQPVNDWFKTNGTDTTWYPKGASMTRQEFAEDCDINVLMDRYQLQGYVPPADVAPAYVDFTEIPTDLMSTMSLMKEAEAAFMTLPAKVRREFENNAHDFVAFASDPGNLDQMREWGLAAPKPDPAATVPVDAPRPASSPASPASSPAGSSAPAGAPTQ